MTSTKNHPPLPNFFIYLHWWYLPSLLKIIFSSYL